MRRSRRGSVPGARDPRRARPPLRRRAKRAVSSASTCTTRRSTATRRRSMSGSPSTAGRTVRPSSRRSRYLPARRRGGEGRPGEGPRPVEVVPDPRERHGRGLYVRGRAGRGDPLPRPAQDLHRVRTPSVRWPELGDGRSLARGGVHGPRRVYVRPHDRGAPLPGLRWRLRYHTFDPQRRYFHWDPRTERVATRSLPVMRGMVYRHLTAPREIHSLRTSLRPGESIERAWTNEGHIVPSGTDKRRRCGPRTTSAGRGRPTASTRRPARRSRRSPPPRGPAGSARRRRTASHRSRFASAAVRGRRGQDPGTRSGRGERTISAGSRSRAMGRRGIRCARRSRSAGGGGSPDRVGGLASGPAERLHRVRLLIKLELQTAGDVRAVGAKDLMIDVRAHAQQADPPASPSGGSIVRVTAERIDPEYALEVAIAYRVDGESFRVVRNVTRIPYAFAIDVPDVPSSSARTTISAGTTVACG